MPQFEPTSCSERERLFIHAYERLVRAGAAYDQGHPSEAPDIAKEVFIDPARVVLDQAA